MSSTKPPQKVKRSSNSPIRLGDGSVVMSGDVVHFHEQLANQGVPPFNWDRGQSLASMERLTAIVASLHAKLIIQHDETHIGRLPTFPKSAR